MIISITSAHITAAEPFPNKSPIALALREMGFVDASVTHHYAYFGDKAYPLPLVAIASEKAFDFAAKGGVLQGEITEILPYGFELDV
jgi:hypothetical protein